MFSAGSVVDLTSRSENFGVVRTDEGKATLCSVH